ncbi:hypothetical protein pb186bvf_007077 [Paramecium bursaria]
MSLDQPLLKSADYGMTASELMELFKPDNIRNGSSTQLLARLGKLDGIYQKLNTDPKKGLNSNDVSDLDLRVKNFGDNKPIEKEQKKLLDYILENFEDKILQILCLAAFVNLIIGVITEGWAEGWMDGFAIFIAVIIIVSVTAGNNYIKDQQFRKLNAIAANRNINVSRLDLNRRAGELTEAESQKIIEVVADSQSYISVWFLNIQKDIRGGKKFLILNQEKIKKIDIFQKWPGK